MTEPLDLEPIKALVAAVESDGQVPGLRFYLKDTRALIAEVERLRAMIAGVFAGRSPEEEAADPGTAGGPFGF